MADGDTDVKINGEMPLPGGGFDGNGNPVQAKKFIWGEITGTYNTGGVTINPSDLRLDVIDYVTFHVVEVQGTTAPAVTALCFANWDPAANNLMINIAANTQHSDSTAFKVNFLAFGDYAGAPDLL